MKRAHFLTFLIYTQHGHDIWTLVWMMSEQKNKKNAAVANYFRSDFNANALHCKQLTKYNILPWCECIIDECSRVTLSSLDTQ